MNSGTSHRSSSDYVLPAPKNPAVTRPHALWAPRFFQPFAGLARWPLEPPAFWPGTTSRSASLKSFRTTLIRSNDSSPCTGGFVNRGMADFAALPPERASSPQSISPATRSGARLALRRKGLCKSAGARHRQRRPDAPLFAGAPAAGSALGPGLRGLLCGRDIFRHDLRRTRLRLRWFRSLLYC